MFVFIDAGEQGLYERFGKPQQELLQPGGHVKLPWPMGRVYRYETERIQSFNVGYTPDPKLANEKAALWTVPHANEQNFLVANTTFTTAVREYEDVSLPATYR